MKRPLPFLLLFPLVCPAALANGMIIDVSKLRSTTAPRQVHLHYHGVEVEITDGVSVTRIDQVFRNPNPRQLEGTYIFPLPRGAAVSRFSLFVNGKETRAEMLDAPTARRIYETIVRSRRDPALLEYLGHRLIRARIFPINAGGDLRIGLSYTELLRPSGGTYRYVYPLDSGRFSQERLREVSFKADLVSTDPIRTVYSPTHKLDVARKTRRVTLRYESSDSLPPTNLVIYYTVARKGPGALLFTHRPKGEDGYFLLVLSPGSDGKTRRVAKDVVFVLDTSGSMLGTRLRQAKTALDYCLGRLGKDDRFAVVAFNTDVETHTRKLVPASAPNLGAARVFVKDLDSSGGTNIDGALTRALAYQEPGRLFMVVFITDGIPTIGELEPRKILQRVAAANRAKARIFVLGLGTDVNTHLLDALCDANRGTGDYVDEGERIDTRVAGFFQKVADPVVSDVSLRFEGIKVKDLYPRRITDLFAGEDVHLFGRYRGDGRARISIRGSRGSERVEIDLTRSFPKEATGSGFLPSLWARRKIGWLLDAMRMHGQSKELVAEVVRLGKRHGIVTPFTSYLALENTPQARALRARVLAEVGRKHMKWDGFLAVHRAQARANLASATGRNAFNCAQKLLEYKNAVNLASEGDLQSFARNRTGGIQRVGAVTFYNVGGTWNDSRFAPVRDDKGARKVKYLSKEYFELLRRNPALKRYFALGRRVVCQHERKWFKVF